MQNLSNEDYDYDYDYSYQDKPLPKPSHSHRRTLSSANTPSRDSSLQKVWAEDYYAAGNAEADCTTLSFEPNHSTPPSEALTTRSTRNIASAHEKSDLPRQSRGHQRALTALLPFRTFRPNSKSPERSLTREKIEGEFMPTLTGDKEGLIKVADKSRGGLASWFSGSSAPVSLGVGVPLAEKELPPPPSMSSTRSNSPERQSGKLQKRPTLQALEPAPAKPVTSRFNFFTSPKTPVKAIQLPAEMINDDEYLSLDINAALFPQGSPPDPFSPAAFKNLLMNAEGILLQLQTAYKLRTLSLHELNAEKSAIADELEEASTRAQCLRQQLEDMATRVSAQDATIAELATELAIEKKARAEEKEAREKSIALVKGNGRRPITVTDPEEDLGIANAASPTSRDRKKWRGSADMSVEGDSDAESGGAESVFSRSRSPTLSGLSTRDSTPEIHQAAFARMVTNTNPPSMRPKVPLQQKSTFQKIIQGISPASPAEGKDEFGGIGLGEEGCSNCRGKDASVAWDTVGLLRAENKGLKEQVGMLEEGVESALALCLGYEVR
ncbi:hypothetical protein G7Y89_g6496 [Cudoniella acicularis]|uniref:Uncharacterized protein n=1 Tax=Cudoniella acicularis TaxID=354080 RepID=A0A8H4W2T7_9HELO|nr:hypothetical protein G7Y89_g6496 [Cudoniella acicularis]